MTILCEFGEAAKKEYQSNPCNYTKRLYEDHTIACDVCFEIIKASLCILYGYCETCDKGTSWILENDIAICERCGNMPVADAYISD